MEEKTKTVLLYYTSLGLFSIFPALVIFLVLSVAEVSPLIAVSAAAVPIAALLLTGFLWRRGSMDSVLPIRLSFWTLKILQSMRAVPQYLPERTVVSLNNGRHLIGPNDGKFLPEETLILLPHCLQNHECPVRLTYDPQGCKRCGKCPIGELLEISRKYGVHFAIASGGTSARRIVEKIRPSLILAAACPVDLSLGIMDVQPISTVGVLIEWRNGPCFDTWVDSGRLAEVLDKYLKC